MMRTIILLLAVAAFSPTLAAQESPFPVPAGLEGAVEFWKLIFTKYSASELVLFDPVDPATIYSVLRVPESEQGRAAVAKERARIAAEYELADDETRIRGQRGAKEQFAEGLRLSGRYMTQMQQIVREEGVPAQLVYLPLVESSFNIRARSGVGAVGMWQFMLETGKKFMRIDTAVDERRDPLSSTRAAARLLKQNYQILGSWPLAITAYNHGTEGIFRGIKAVGSDNLVDLIRGYQSPTFGFASKNFYAEFLAVVEIAGDSESYFPFLRPHPPLTLREVALKGAAALSTVFKLAAISQRDFFDWNPALEPSTKVVPSGYRVKLPVEKLDHFVTAHERALEAVSTKKASVVLAKNAAIANHRSGKATQKALAKSFAGASPASRSQATTKNLVKKSARDSVRVTSR